MKKNFWLLGLASLVFIILSASRYKGTTQEADLFAEEYVPNEVLVRFKEDTGKHIVQFGVDSVQGKILTYLGNEIALVDWNPDVSSVRSFLSDPYLLHIRVPEYIGTEQAVSLLLMNPNVEYAEKNMVLHLFVNPNDPHFSKLWGMNNTGQTGGTVDADIDAPEAWNIFTGSPNVVVAVIDTGVNYNHEDLKANIWTNSGECGNGKETDGVDNDGNGYRDDWRGWNFAYNNNNPMDDNSHGTHVAGTIGAAGNNGKGVAGISWTVKLMAIKIFDEGAYGSVSNAIHAVDYATENGACISSNSYGWAYNDPDLVANKTAYYNAINRAKNKGKLFIAAAGNYQGNTQWYDNDKKAVYPSCYDLDNIVSVLSTDHNDILSSFSHYGKTTVDIGAPGGTNDGSNKDIYSTVLGNNYAFYAGTSMASLMW